MKKTTRRPPFTPPADRLAPRDVMHISLMPTTETMFVYAYDGGVDREPFNLVRAALCRRAGATVRTAVAELPTLSKFDSATTEGETR